MHTLLAQEGAATITIDTQQIPDHIRMDLLSIIYDATAAYFKQPGVEERYERWKAEREKRQLKTGDRKE